MSKLGLIPGEIVELKARAQSAGIASSASPEDEDSEIIKMGLLMRENCGVNVDDFIEVKKAQVSIAKELTLIPYKMNLSTNRRFNALIKRNLKQTPVTVNDLIVISKDISIDITFLVKDLIPKGICVLDNSTKIKIISDIREQLELI
jgi:hypothetical protein